MKKTVLILLTLCLLVFMTGCDSSGGSSSSSEFDDIFNTIEKGSGKKFVVYDIDPHTGITDFSRVSGKGIQFKEGGTQIKIFITIFLNDNKQFTSTEEGWMGGYKIGNSQFTGTWSQSGQTITMHATKEKDLDSGKTQSCDKTEKTTLSADGNTMTDIDADPNFHSKWVYKKQ
jgi:hypothetical protein